MTAPSTDRATPDVGGAFDLRTRNRDRNRADVARLALELFDRHGFDQVTVDDIAEAAGISRRTFFRYFDTKEDAVLPDEHERLEQLRAALADRPADEPLIISLRHATLALLGDDRFDRDEAVARFRIVMGTPSVHARSLELQTRWESEIRSVIAEHLGVDPERDVAARVLAASTVASFRAAAEVWMVTGGRRDLVDLLEEAYDVLLGAASWDASSVSGVGGGAGRGHVG